MKQLFSIKIKGWMYLKPDLWFTDHVLCPTNNNPNPLIICPYSR
jgi:hypothetical protein